MADQSLLTQVPFNAYPWQAGHAYAPGDIVTPTTAPSAGAVAITNADFAATLTGWSGASFSWDGTHGYNSTGCARMPGSSLGSNFLTSTNQVAVTPGQTVNASCFVGTTNPIAAQNMYAICFLAWYDASHAQLAIGGASLGSNTYFGTITGTGVQWAKASVSGTAPPGAAFLAVGVAISNTQVIFDAYVDAFTWDYQAPSSSSSSATPPQYFTSVSSATLTSGLTEPDWTNGGSNTGNVSDNGITWARGIQSVIYWMTNAQCMSSNIEPTWGIGQGASVLDGDPSWYAYNFHWIAQTPVIQDANCPQSTVVAIGASHIFAGNGDIVRFSAAANCLDWTSEGDSGYLPTGLQNYGANSISAMGLYRSNLCVFNSQGFQIWQIDEDPAAMALLEAIPIGCSYAKTVVPVNTDLFFCAAQGVRSVSISGGSGNTQAGDIGMPVDPIVQAGLAYCNANGTEPLSIYIPSQGQYWIYFPGWTGSGYFKNTPSNTANVMVYTMSRTGQVGAWSRYNFPFANIEAFCQAGDYLYIQSADDTLQLDPAALYDYYADNYNHASRQQTFTGVVQWPWLDNSQPGVTKLLSALDVTCSQNTTVTIEIGYDQSNLSLFTTPYVIPGDTVPGSQIPMSLLAPTFSPRLSMISTDNWQVQQVNLYLDDGQPAA